jgi:hypothetical protein
MTEIEILISNIINNPLSLINILINSIKYNPTAWVVFIAILIVSVFAFTYGCLTRRKDYIILTLFLLSAETALILLFNVSALSGFKIEFIIDILINSIKYNPTAWVVSIAILIVSVFAFTYGCLTSRKDYIILTFFLLTVGTALTLLFYVSALSGFKIEFII